MLKAVLVLLVLAIALAIFLRQAQVKTEVKEDQPHPLPSPVAAAMVVYNSRQVSLNTSNLVSALTKSDEVSAQEIKAELRPGANLFYVLVTKPAELTIVINDSQTSEEDNKAMAKEAEEKKLLPKDALTKLKECTAHLALSSLNHKMEVQPDKTLKLTSVDLDLQSPGVAKVLKILKETSQGLVFDCQDDRWIEP